MKRLFLISALALGIQGTLHSSDVLAQVDFATFASAPYIERAERAASQQNWQEVIRLTEHVLGRFSNHLQARRLYVQALIAEGQFERAENALQPLGADGNDLQQALRQRWVSMASPSVERLNEWQRSMTPEAWLELMRNALYQRESREGRQTALALLTELNDGEPPLALVLLSLDFLGFAEAPTLEQRLLLRLEREQQLGAQNAIRLAHLLTDEQQNTEIERILAEQQEASWFETFQRAHIDRLVGTANYGLAIERLLAAWSWQDMPTEIRAQLTELALLDENLSLIARPDLRPADECLDSVAWLGERSPSLAESLLSACDPSLDPERWNFLATLYAPDLAEDTSAAEEEYAERVRLLEQAEAALALRQRDQDALDAAWLGQCPEEGAFSGALRDELLALCLSEALPGVATIYFARVLSDPEHPRHDQLIRAAAYVSYDAGDYPLALQYWQGLTLPLDREDRDAISATEAAQALLDERGDERPRLSLDALQALADEDPDSYARELGMRLSGQSSAELRETAIPWLERGRQQAPHDFRLPEALSYRYFESGETELSTANARAAIDSMDPHLAVGPATPDELTQRLFNLRRSHQFMTQRNRVYLASTWARAGVPAAIGATQTANTFQLASVERLLGDAPTVAGRQLALYGRALSADTRHQRFFSDPAFGAGLRWKPLGSQDINAFAELYRSPEGNNDVMLRLSGSFLNTGALRDDWRAGERHWTWQVLYLDGAYFVDNDIYQFFGSYQLGHDFRLSPSLPHTLAPYVTAFRGESNDFSDTVVGAGLRYRLWFTQDRYNAWRNRVDLRVELNHSVSGFQQGAQGWRVLLEWQL